jgi:hypothetical protein
MSPAVLGAGHDLRLELGEASNDFLRPHEREVFTKGDDLFLDRRGCPMWTLGRGPGSILKTCQARLIMAAEPLVHRLPTDTVARRKLGDPVAATQIVFNEPRSFEHATGLLPRHSTLLAQSLRKVLPMFPVCSVTYVPGLYPRGRDTITRAGSRL